MDAIFINSENSKTSHPHRFLLNLTDKTDLKTGKKLLLCQIVVFMTHGKHKQNLI